MVSINTSLLLIIGAIAISLIDQIVGQTQDTTQITEWYGRTDKGELTTLESTTANNYINEISVGVHSGINIDIGGIEAYFTDNSLSKWESASAQNDFGSFTVNNDECISKVSLTHKSNCCLHSLQFETTDSQLSPIWGSFLGVHAIINYGHQYCLSKIEIVHEQPRAYIGGIRFHFIPNPYTQSPTPAPTNNPTPYPISNPTHAPTPAPIAGTINPPTPDPISNPTLATRAPTPAPISSPTPDPISNPTLATPAPIEAPSKAPTPAQSTTQTSEWYGWPHGGDMTILQADMTDIYINKVSVGVNTGTNIDIGGVEAYFTDNSHVRFESGSAQNDFSSFTVNDGECISKVSLTFARFCCPHSLQFETTDSQLSPIWGSWIGAHVIINYGNQYCLSRIDILGEQSANYIWAIRFHFIQNPNTPNPTPAPTNAPTAPSKSPTSSPTPAPSEAPTNSPIAIPTTNPTRTPTSAPIPAPTYNPTIYIPISEPTMPSQAPTSGLIAVPTTNPIHAPTPAQLQGPNTVVLSGPGGELAIYTLVNCKYQYTAVANADIDVTGEIESVGPDAAGVVGDMVTSSVAATISGSKVIEFGTMAALRVTGTWGTSIVAHEAFTVASIDDNEPSSGEISKYPTTTPTPAPTASTKPTTN